MLERLSKILKDFWFKKEAENLRVARWKGCRYLSQTGIEVPSLISRSGIVLSMFRKHTSSLFQALILTGYVAPLCSFMISRYLIAFISVFFGALFPYCSVVTQPSWCCV